MIFTRRTLPNAFKALGRVVRTFFKGAPTFVSAEEDLHRTTICHACHRYVQDSDQCLECTCFVSTKTLLTSESCPLKKW